MEYTHTHMFSKVTGYPKLQFVKGNHTWYWWVTLMPLEQCSYKMYIEHNFYTNPGYHCDIQGSRIALLHLLSQGSRNPTLYHRAFSILWLKYSVQHTTLNLKLVLELDQPMGRSAGTQALLHTRFSPTPCSAVLDTRQSKPTVPHEGPVHGGLKVVVTWSWQWSLSCWVPHCGCLVVIPVALQTWKVGKGISIGVPSTSSLNDFKIQVL